MHKSLILVMCLKLYKGQQGSQVIHVRLQPYIWFVCSSPLILPLVWFSSPLVPPDLCVSCARSPCNVLSREGSLVPAFELQILWRPRAGPSHGHQQGEHFCWESFYKPSNKPKLYSRHELTEPSQKSASPKKGHGTALLMEALHGCRDRGCRPFLPASILPARMYSGKWYWLKCLGTYHRRETIDSVIDPTGYFQSKPPR